MALSRQLSPPNATDIVVRLQWATDRMWDLAEGVLDPPVAGLLWSIVVGWADLCDLDERRQYLTIASQLETMMASFRGE